MFAVHNMNYSLKIYSRIGELMQGIQPDGTSFLVSGLPSRTFFSEAILEEGTGQRDLPPKADLALSLLLLEHEQRTGRKPAVLADRDLRIHSNIPAGKGLASSSADVLSVLCLVNDHLQTGFTREELYGLACRVEPTDPCLSDDTVLFRQHSGITERVFPLPPLTLSYFDAAPEWKIDTLDVQRPWQQGAGAFFASLIRRFRQAADEADYETLFDCVSASALYNQSVISLPRFEEYYQLAREEKAGIMVAHSGTIIGLLSRPESAPSLCARLGSLSPAGAGHAAIFTETFYSILH